MSTKQLIETAPKDRAILLHFPDEGWTQGIWNEKQDWVWLEETNWSGYVGGWDVLILPSHGCSCCSSTNPQPDFWMELP